MNQECLEIQKKCTQLFSLILDMDKYCHWFNIKETFAFMTIFTYHTLKVV